MSEKSFDSLLEEFASDSEFQQAFMEEDLINRVGLRVLAYRKAEGLAQNELAERTETRQPAIAKIEAGESNLTLRKLAQLALALECDPADLICEAEPQSLKARWQEAGRDAPRELVSHVVEFLHVGAVGISDPSFVTGGKSTGEFLHVGAVGISDPSFVTGSIGVTSNLGLRDPDASMYAFPGITEVLTSMWPTGRTTAAPPVLQVDLQLSA